jgi:hypothetical protein
MAYSQIRYGFQGHSAYKARLPLELISRTLIHNILKIIIYLQEIIKYNVASLQGTVKRF